MGVAVDRKRRLLISEGTGKEIFLSSAMTSLSDLMGLRGWWMN